MHPWLWSLVALPLDILQFSLYSLLSHDKTEVSDQDSRVQEPKHKERTASTPPVKYWISTGPVQPADDQH